MIQRRQTIFLALILLIVILQFFLPVYNLSVSVEGQTFVAFRKLQQLKILSICLGVVVLITLITIFMYKQRKRQMLWANFGLLISLGLFTACIALPKIFSAANLYTDGVAIPEYGMGVYLMALIPVMFFLAGRSIKKDEDLVKAADRLR